MQIILFGLRRKWHETLLFRTSGFQLKLKRDVCWQWMTVFCGIHFMLLDLRNIKEKKKEFQLWFQESVTGLKRFFEIFSSSCAKLLAAKETGKLQFPSWNLLKSLQFLWKTVECSLNVMEIQWMQWFSESNKINVAWKRVNWRSCLLPVTCCLVVKMLT